MTKPTVNRCINSVLIFLVIQLQDNFIRASPVEQKDADSSTSVVSFPGKYTWGFGKDLSEPISFVGSESKSSSTVVRLDGTAAGSVVELAGADIKGSTTHGNTAGSVVGLAGADIQGSTTHGNTGRWVGRAIPVVTRPKSTVVTTSVVVRGGTDTSTGGSNPFGGNRPTTRRPTTRRPSTNRPSVFNPGNNVFIPYGTSQPRLGGNPHIITQPGFAPPYVNFNFIPHGYSRGYYNSPLVNNIIHSEGEPSFLLHSKSVVDEKDYLLQTNSDSAEKQNQSSHGIEVQADGQNQVELNQGKNESASNDTPFFVTTFPRKERTTTETPEPTFEAKALERSARLKFVPITFVPTTIKTTTNSPFSFNSFFPRTPSSDRPEFIPFNFTSATTSTEREFDLNNFLTPETTTHTASSFDEIDINDIGPIISGIIRIVPSRRRGNASHTSDPGFSGSPNRFSPQPTQAPQPTRPPVSLPPPPTFPTRRPTPPQATSETDDDGWTIITPRYRGTIRRTFLVPNRRGQSPSNADDVEIITVPSVTTVTREDRPNVIKSLKGDSGILRSRDEDRRGTMPKSMDGGKNLMKDQEEGEEQDGEWPDSSTPLSDIDRFHNKVNNQDRDHLYLTAGGSNRPTTISVMTVTSAITMGVLVTNWLFQ